MTETTARAMIVKQARRDGCTCETGAPQIAFREDDSTRIVLVGHGDECARTVEGGPVGPGMRVLLMHISRELEVGAWEQKEVES